MEIWRDIRDYEGLYQVSNEGRVRSLEREIKYLVKGKYPATRIFPSVVLKPYMNNSGYLMVDLIAQDKKGKETIHRLVATAFIPNPENKPCIDHINGDKNDNRVENLIWCTHGENNNNPLTKEKRSKTMKGRDYPWLHSEETNKKRANSLIGHRLSYETKDKISKANSKQVFQYNLDGELIAIYENSVVASEKTGFPQAQINKHAHGKYYSKLRKKWYFKNEYKGYKWSLKPL